MTKDHVQWPIASLNLVDCSFDYLLSNKKNCVSDLNHNQVTAWLFFIALPYKIGEIESRCPQYNSRQTEGRSHWDQTHTADNSFFTKPICNLNASLAPGMESQIIKYAL